MACYNHSQVEFTLYYLIEMNETCYLLSPKKIREDERIKSLDPMVRGIYRDLLDLMWLTKNQCSIAFKHEIIADRLNCTSIQLKKAVKRLSTGDQSLLEVTKTPAGEYLISPMLERQKDGVFDGEVLIRDAITKKESPEMGSLADFVSGKSNPYRNKTQIKPDEAIMCISYKGWFPTARFNAVGEAFKMDKIVREHIQEEAPSVNLDSCFQDAFDWLMRPDNQDRRPSYANMTTFLSKFATNSEKRINKAQIIKGTEGQKAMSEEDFEAEMERLLEGE